MPPLPTLVAPHSRVEAGRAPAPRLPPARPRPRPAAPHAATAHHASVHLLDRVLAVTLALVDDEGEARRILGQPQLPEAAELGERSLQLLLTAVDAQVGDVDAVAVLFLVVAVLLGSTSRS